MQLDRVLTKPFALTMLAEFALCTSIGMLLAVVPVYADDELGVGSFGVAVAVAAVSPMVLVCQPLAGRYADRNGRRILVVAGGVLAALAVAAYVVADSLPLLVVLRLLTGTGEAMALVGAATIVTDLAPEHRRGEALSIFSLGLWGGLALGPLIGELVLGDTRFDAVWLLAASCCLAARADRAPPSGDGALASSRPSSRMRASSIPAAIGPGPRARRSPSSASPDSARSARCTRATSASTGRAPSSSRSRRSSSRRASSPGRCPTGSGRSARPESRSALISAGLFTIGLWNVPAGLFVGTVVVAFGHALAFPSLMTLAVNSAPVNERSSVVGTFSAFTELGFLVGALSLGAVASAAGYDGVFVVCAFGPLLGVLVLSRLTRRDVASRYPRLPSGYGRAARWAAMKSRYQWKLSFGTRSSVSKST